MFERFPHIPRNLETDRWRHERNNIHDQYIKVQLNACLVIRLTSQLNTNQGKFHRVTCFLLCYLTFGFSHHHVYKISRFFRNRENYLEKEDSG